ncbi:hypothetical protein B296_00055994 [Ensete ventricosum]|uniref:Uncharacterized protein n=1 Tax=Ensete ventricosum TaxID=4639 RepID=A0A426X023_ENSVE|nr:hypothetical protein B296_00055994 [Ensete ventricosum]
MSYEHGFTKNATVINFARRFEFQSIFCAPSQKFKILAIPNILAHGKSYELGFTKKCFGHKLCVELQGVKFRSVFRVLFWKFKILAIPDVLAYWK